MSEHEPCGCGPSCTCDACRGVHDATPVAIDNRPGLSAIRARVGDHSQFKESLLADISRARLPALRGLTTRADDDFAIALLDAFAVMADVLTFYQERIANESYLRTAVERLSVGYVAKLIGYELRPGSAANVAFAFRMTEGVGTVAKLTLEIGTRVQSTPGPGETPQTFETVEELEIRPAWNAIPARPTRPQPLSTTTADLYLAGGALNLRAGDAFLLVFKDGVPPAVTVVFRRARKIELDPKGQWTHVIFDPDETLSASFASAKASQRGVFVLRTRAALFGHNAPEFVESHKHDVPPTSATDWTVDANATDATHLALDAVYKEVVAGGWGLWESASTDPPKRVMFRVSHAPEHGYALYGLGGRTTRIAAELPTGSADSFKPATFADLRTTTVHVLSDKIELATLPDAPLAGNEIHFDRRVGGLEPGRRVAVAGKSLSVGVLAPVTLTVTTPSGPTEVALDSGDTLDLTEYPVTDDDGVTTYVGVRDGQPAQFSATDDQAARGDVDAAELATIASVAADGRSIVLVDPLGATYDPATVTVNVNVVAATQGAAVKENFEGGDATQRFQRFALKQTPLTYVTAPTASGTQSTLRVYVGDVEWHEVPYLHGRGPDERVFITRMDGEGRTWVQFGDGVTGARLPTGVQNVRAEYRRGIGAGGNLDAGTINLPVSRPLGLKDVSNPVASSDGKDAEALADARRNAPLSVLTLDRVVSLRDFEDFARAFGGVVKAAATWTWFGRTRGVFLTVAGDDGTDLSVELRTDLVDAIATWGDPHVPVRAENHTPRTFRTGLRVKVDPDHVADKVLEDVEAALRDAFSFANRDFGRTVSAAEVSAVAQGVRGVAAVVVTALHLADDADSEAGLEVPLPARLPYAGERDEVLAAELLTLDPAPLDLLEEMP